MAILDLKSHKLHYRIDGEDTSNPWLMFSNSLGTNLGMWDRQVPSFAQKFRILRYDRRGHGLSTAPPAPCTVDELGRDAIALMDALNISRTHFCGLSIGGLVAQWLGIHTDRLEKVIVCATAARIGTAESWASRIDAVTESGLQPLVPATAQRWFSPAFRQSQPDEVSRLLEDFTKTSPEGYIGCCHALATTDLSADISKITIPLLAISGNDDMVCPEDDLRFIADRVQQGHHLSLPGGHIVNLEAFHAFNSAVDAFLHR
jgi:3-oxoadipate enol-lactonase